MSSQPEDVVERVRATGVRSASAVDLMAIAFSRRHADVTDNQSFAREMVKRYDRISRLAEVSFSEITERTGLEEFEVLRSLALIELGRRSGFAEKGPQDEIEVPEDVYALLEYLRYEKQEHFVVLLMDAKNKVFGKVDVHKGTLTSSLVGPREVFRAAIREGASSIIVAHNHPSGDPSPSPEDLEVTRRLVEVGKMLDIPVLDHVIIGDPRSVSFSRQGLL